MEEFPSNSKSPAGQPKKKPSEPKKVEKIVQSEVIRRKKPLGKRFAETFVPGDAKGVAAHVFMDVLIPMAKDMVVEGAQEYLHKMIYGNDSTKSRRAASRAGSPFGRIDYAGISSGGAKKVYGREDPRDARPSRRSRTAHNFDEIILGTRVEAEEVIDRLFDIVSQYEVATVRDLYDLVGQTAQWTDEKWGWTDIRGAAVTRISSGGYLLDLPRPEPID